MKLNPPEKIHDLIEHFHRNLEVYRQGKYNETQLRREFIDPLFKTLGWDVDNEQGYAEAYKDVIHEDAIRVGGATKAPDYCFRIGGTRKFFLEAKKPAISIKNDIQPAYQLRRYAWSARLPLIFLTYFEEFAVYDCHYDRMATIVDQMLLLHQQVAAAKTEHEKTVLQRQIEATDQQIDQLVYELYGLTEEEARIVKGKENRD